MAKKAEEQADFILEELTPSEKELRELDILEEIIPTEEEASAVEGISAEEGASGEKPRKPKAVITYTPVSGEKLIRMKFKDGQFHSYEVTINYPRREVYDTKRQKYVSRSPQERKTFSSLDDAILWRNEHQNEQVEARQKKIDYKKQGATLIAAAEAYYADMEQKAEKGKLSLSYLDQLRIQTDHFRRFFNGNRTTYVKTIDTKQIEEYFQFEEDRGISRASIVKYKSHLKAIWTFMMKDRATYGIKENVVPAAQITTPKSEYKANVLNYKQIGELITEACQFDDPTFLYIVVFSMTQGLRRGELCGLMWQDIDFEKRRVKICHNRVQIVTADTTKLPKREKTRIIELHRVSYETLQLYKEWQERILGREVEPEAFVLQWEINLIQNYVCHTGKVSRKWKEIYAKINKAREKEGKELIPYGRIHDGRHIYVTFLLQGIKRDDGTIIKPASYFQVYQSAGHEIPKAMQNVSTTVYNEDVGDRWDVTRFWDETLTVDVHKAWEDAQQAYEELSPFERDLRVARKQKRMEKAKKERLKSHPPEETLQTYEE